MIIVNSGSALNKLQSKEIMLFDQTGDENFKVRRLQITDFDKGYLEVLKGLTQVGDTTKKQFIERYNEMFPRLQ